MRRLLAALLILLALAVPGSTQADETWQVVRNVRLYTEPSSLAQKITTLHAPEQVTRIGTRREGDYIHVRTESGQIGWVYIRSVSLASPTSPDTGTTPALSLRPLGTGEMRAHFIDVGQGAATLLEFRCGAVLVDTGGEENPDCDSNARLLAYLTQFFAARADLQNTIDLVVLSHPHADHTKGVPTVLGNFMVRNAIDNGQSSGSGSGEQAQLEEYSQQHSDVGYEAIHLDTIDRASGRSNSIIDPVKCSDGDPRIRVLWGEVRTNPGWGETKFGNPNNHSVVVRVDFGDASFLFTGDLEDVAINDMVRRYAGTQLLDVDVYEAGHHGSRNGTTAAFVQAMTPEMAVISMGPASRQRPRTAWQYGHPNAQAIGHLEAGISGRRPAVRVPVGTKAMTFEDREVSAAIYGTGWEGTVVVTARLDGTIGVNSSNLP